VESPLDDAASLVLAADAEAAAPIGDDTAPSDGESASTSPAAVAVQPPDVDESFGQTVDIGGVLAGADVAAENGDHPAPRTSDEVASTDALDATTDLDYADYLTSIEAAAARSRAEQRGRAVPRMRPAAVVVASEPSAPTLVAADAAVTAGSANGQPPNRTARGRQGRQPRRGKDPRPWHKRPKSWFIIAAMVPVSLSIVLAIYFGNLAKSTYDAYNQIHVDPTPRQRIEINPQGTPEVVPTDEVAALLPDWDKKEKVNILLLGIDPRPDDTDPPRSDTIIVVHVDPANETVATMSIPRDLLVEIPGFGEDKINAAYPLGEANSDSIPGGGPALVAETIEANFGIPIHYFATVDFDGFRKIVDTIGGVVLDVPAPVKDDQYPTEDYGLTRVYFPTGLQKMDGEQALEYARTRHSDNDIARGDRQQQVLQAIREQAISLNLISNASELISEVGDSVRTDLNFNQMLALANLGRKIGQDNIQTINLWDMGLITEHDPESEDDPFYFQADWDGVRQIMADRFAVEPPATPTPEPTATPSEEPTSTATATVTPTDTVTAGEASPSTNDAAPTVTDSTTIAPDDTPTVGPGPNVNFAAPVVVQNSSGIDLLATDGVDILTSAGFSEVYPDASDQPLPNTVIYDNVGSPETALYVAQLLGLPATAIQPGIGGTAILVVLGEDVPLSVLRPN